MITCCERCVARWALGDRPAATASRATAHRWFQTWTETGLWPTIHRTILDELGRRALLDWSRATVDSQSIRAKRGGEHRAKPH
ncbi:hypothetical protein [Nocardiopsis sp. LOL_012]|uniref:hypothetical protein n=1 Tax=Nocardiopsis sp. LOL_012 TaxID=3345409 RepID=UPI003A84D1CA